MTDHPRILQIVPAPPGLLLHFARYGEAWSVPALCLGLVEHPDGRTSVEPIDITGGLPDEDSDYTGPGWADTEDEDVAPGPSKLCF